MRRIVAFLVLAAMLLCTLALGVSAEMSVTAEYKDGVITFSWNGAPGSAVLSKVVINGMEYPLTGNTLPLFLDKTAGGTATFTVEGASLAEQPAFTVPVDFQITSAYDPATKTLSGTWGGTSYTQFPVTHVRINGTDYPAVISGADPAAFAADLSLITEPGEYSVTYVLSVNGTAVTQSGGSFTIEDPSIPTQLTVEKQPAGGYITTLTDEQGTPLTGALISMRKNGVVQEVAYTDGMGKGTFISAVLPEEEGTLDWYFEGGDLNGSLYKSATVKLEITVTTTTTTTTVATETTTSTTAATTATTTSGTIYTPISTTTTASRWPTYSSTQPQKTTTGTTTRVEWGATTTGRYDTAIIVNAIYDAAILKTFGLKASLFSEQARLLMEAKNYQSLAQMHAANLMLSVFPTEDKLADSVLEFALNSSEEYGFYTLEDAKSFALDLSIAAVKGEGDYTVLEPTMIPQDTYTVYLPVPDAFRDCDLAVISLEQEGAQLIEAITNNGTFSFEVDHFGSYAVVAFPAATRTLSVPVLAIVLFVLAGFCLIGAGLILYFFVIRTARCVAKAESGRENAVLLTYGGEEVEPLIGDMNYDFEETFDESEETEPENEEE